MKRIELLLLIVILIGAFAVRFYRIDNPIADWHSWRQSDTSAVSRNFIKYGFDLLHPRFDDLSKTPSGMENPQGYRFVEFPLYNGVVALSSTLFPLFSIEIWGRLITIIASLGSLIFLYLLSKKYLGTRVAIFTAFFFGFLPYNIYYSRTILPDPSMVMAILGGTYFFDLWIEKRMQNVQWIYFALGLIFTAVAFLLKPFALFFTLPMIYLAFKRWGIDSLRRWELWLFIILTLVPLIAWRIWITQFPEGIPAATWLLNGNNIRFKGAFFQWIFADRLGRLILGYWGIFLLGLGIIKKTDNKGFGFIFSSLLSSLLYLFVIATGNVQHDYYQILIIPTVTILLAQGADFLLWVSSSYVNRIASYSLLIVSCACMFIFGWFYIRDYFNINNPSIVEAGKKANELLPYQAKVIAPYGGDTSFLYQTNRQGWPIVDKPIEKMIEMGAEYLVIVTPTKNDFDGFGKKYTNIDFSPSYLILKLK